jgi:hypothetical protein
MVLIRPPKRLRVFFTVISSQFKDVDNHADVTSFTVEDIKPGH